jgi:hypothetical protein
MCKQRYARLVSVLSIVSSVLWACATPAVAETPYAQRSPLTLTEARPNRTRVPRCEKFELTLQLTATYDNPFDPDQIEVYAIFTAPRGRPVTLPAFLYQPFTRSIENGNEKLTPAGEPVWKIRFAPEVPGNWTYQVFARDRSGLARLPQRAFQVIPSKNPGFIRLSRRNPRAFAFEGEKPFFAVGENMGWAGNAGTYDYAAWLPALGKAGGNWIRIWMSSWNCALEWTTPREGSWSRGTYHGVGVYSLENAWKLDAILDMAEQHGVYTMLCFGTYGEFTDGGFFNEGQWKFNPYNAANGGPCARPADFWTNPEAKKLYRRRLRYLLARYGYRTSIHSWEFWNEANPPADWVAEMARYVKGTGVYSKNGPADPHRHLLTTTYGTPAIWKIPEIDITQSHHYGTGNIPDHAPVIRADAMLHAVYGKPHLMGEFGIDWRDTDTKYDPEGKGINFHNGMWASAMTGNAGSAMLWWWDNYVHPLSQKPGINLYARFTPLRRFADTVPWTEGVWKPLERITVTARDATPTYSDLVVSASGDWGKSASDSFTLAPTGLVGNHPLPGFLYAPAKAELRTTPRFHLNCEQPSRFALRVNTVSNFARLVFRLDGETVKEVTLQAAPPAEKSVSPEYEETKFMPEYGIYQAKFNKEYAIAVPAGKHTVQLEIADGDWLTVETYTVTNYRSSRYPAVSLYGLTTGKSAIFWAQNALHNWKNVAEKRPIPPIEDATVTFTGLRPGNYTVIWWDTWQGAILRRSNATATAQGITLPLPTLVRDVAARLIPSD